MLEYKDLFGYDDIKIEGKTRLSPSGFCNFYESPAKWYNQQIKKEDTFRGNTNTVIGDIIHARIGAYWTGIKVDTDVEVRYLDIYKDNPEVKDWEVANQVASAWELVADTISTMDKPTDIEQRTIFEIPNTDYFIGGTYDYRGSTYLGDIKTIATTPKQIKFNHKFQLYMYYLSELFNGRADDVEHIEVLYIVKTKTPKVLLLKEPIDDEFVEFTKTEIKKMIKRLELCKQDESLVELMFTINPNSYL